MKKRYYPILGVLALLFAASACQQTFTPKPKGYFEIPLPQKEYKVFDEPGYPYTFEYPAYSKIVKDTVFFDAAPENPYWINLEFPELNSKIYLSYKTIGGKNSIEQLVNDAFRLTYKHTYKAEFINERDIATPNNAFGLYYDVGGNAASAKQFFVTDSTRHFLRGALYFYAAPNADSLAPVIQFLQADMEHLVGTLKWR
ncbi:gliding motility lipoprotein GldD [Chitinophaga horti]|uniref:Gliding motility lipoprotein GldD n=1 Tax=Chitinophaga horti TaxID=2920382 RepID=A0ABY6J008_9BACT|nr:gliding motility lipoprotein GldD [Chitinophaga horti]UYQ93008.1 gliding motility lipoprotein GldD [Chitinophaga horti]